MTSRLHWAARTGIAVAIGLAAATCGSVEPFACIEDDQCDARAQGRCVAPGVCAFPDPQCASGYRYHDSAGSVAKTCVPVMEADATTGETTGAPTPGDSSDDASSSSGGIAVGSTGDGSTSEGDASTSGADSTTGADSGTGNGDESTGGECEEGLCPCATALSVGIQHNCVIRNDGSVVCWGADNFGQLGTGMLNPPNPHPQLVALPAGSIAIELGSANQGTCAVLDDGAVWCWGRNDWNQTGLRFDPKNDVAPPSGDNGATNASLVAPLLFSSCALDGAGMLTCWGRNNQFQLATEEPAPGPHETGPHLVGATAMVGGTGHACMWNADEVWCWGQGVDGQHGFGEGVGPVSTPAPVSAFDLQLPVVGVGAGRLHTCIAHAGGATVECVGRNEEAQIDVSITTEYFEPVEVDLIIEDPIVAIRSRQDTTCVQVDNGDLYCWGSVWGYDHGTAYENGVPLFPPGRVVAADEIPDPIVDFGVGTRHVCALTNTGRVHCWGTDAQEQLGATDPGPGMRTVEIDLNCP